MSIRTVAEPTVPRPARPSLSGSAMRKTGCSRGLAACLQGNDVVQNLVGVVEELPEVARGLTDALLVLDQRETHEALALLTEADARRNGKARLLDQELRK